MKSILIIGMGKFGHHLCENLLKLGNDVMAVDISEDKVADMIYKVTNIQIGDCTNPQVVKSLGVGNFDIVFVCIGSNFQNSLEVTSLVKEMGAMHVISKANRDVHAKFLLRNGADEVIYPDRDIAVKLAKRYSINHVFDYIELDDEHAIFEVTIPEEWVGKTVGQLDIRKKYKINIMALKEDGRMDLGITPSTLLGDDATMLVLGNIRDIERCFKL